MSWLEPVITGVKEVKVIWPDTNQKFRWQSWEDQCITYSQAMGEESISVHVMTTNRFSGFPFLECPDFVSWVAANEIHKQVWTQRYRWQTSCKTVITSITEDVGSRNSACISLSLLRISCNTFRISKSSRCCTSNPLCPSGHIWNENLSLDMIPQDKNVTNVTLWVVMKESSWLVKSSSCLFICEWWIKLFNLLQDSHSLNWASIRAVVLGEDEMDAMTQWTTDGLHC